jgi:hypothetical protein
VTRKYPLELLKRAREAKVDTTSRALSVAQRRVTSAEGEIERRVKAKLDLEREQRATSDDELRLLEHGALTSADLERAAAWRVAADRERASHQLRVDEATGVLAKAREETEQKRQALAHVQKDAELVGHHRDRWLAAQQKEAATQEEESAEETYLARSFGEANR